MTHPDDRLADYVDGSLAPDERAVVDAHLASCATCRDEVALATDARGALEQLREPVPVPAEVGRRAIDEAAGSRGAAAGGPSPAAAPGVPRWYRWVGAAAAAAAVVLAVAVAVPTLTGSDDAERAADGVAAAGPEDAATAEAGREPALERLAGNLEAADLPALTDEVRGTQNPPDAAAQPTEAAFFAASDAARATTCLRTAFPSITSAPLRLLSMRFEDTPAYGGVFFTRATDEAPYDAFHVIVASRDDCALLSSSAVRA